MLLQTFRKVFVALSFLTVASSLATVATSLDDACNLFLQNYVPQIGETPFTVKVSPNSVKQGGTVTIEVTSDHNLEFIGFIIQARNGLNPQEIVGEFITPADDIIFKFIDCVNPDNRSATHSSSDPLTKLTLTWKAPSNYQGTVIFRANVLERFERVWSNVESSVVIVTGGGNPDADIDAKPVKRSFLGQNEFYEDCGLRKTCFGYPSDCVSRRSCSMVTAVEYDGSKFIFELRTATNDNPAYVAVALSTDDKMPDSSVMECCVENGQVKSYNSWTLPADDTRDVSQDSSTLLEGSIVDGNIFCRVERQAVTEINGHKIDLETNAYYLLLAVGSYVTPSKVGIHNIAVASASSIKLTTAVTVASSSTLLLRLHGILMVIAWLGTATFGMITARYFKRTWVGSKLCGRDEWFVIHQACMMLTWFLTTAAFVMIFIKIDGWSAEDNPHAILGTVTTIFAYLLPLGGLLRPEPKSKRRIFFNWNHFLFGNLTHLLALITIFFSFKLGKAQLPESTNFILLGYVIFYVFIHLILTVFQYLTDRNTANKLANLTAEAGLPSKKQKRDPPFSRFRKALFFINFAGLLTFVIWLSVTIAQVDNNVTTS